MSPRTICLGVIALAATSCGATDPPSPPRTARASFDANAVSRCGTRTTLFDHARSNADVDLELIMSASWDPQRAPEVVARLVADPATYAARFHGVVIAAPPASHVLAVYEPMAFVRELRSADPALATHLAAKLVDALSTAIDCSADPGGATRLRRARAEAELAILSDAQLEEMTR